MKSITVHVIWDEEAKLFVATSDDVPGLVSEAATFESLRDRVMAIIPELMAENAHLIENHIPDGIDVCLLSEYSQHIELSH